METINVSLNNILFKFEEDAYNKLEKYLDKVKMQYSYQESDEIIKDLEASISEKLFELRNSTGKTVKLRDINNIIEELGEPESIADETSEPKKETTFQNEPEKKLFRDPSDKWLGGVCSGLGYYFNIDPVILRITFLCFFFIGMGPLVYIALWIVIPKATTEEEKCSMMNSGDTFRRNANGTLSEISGLLGLFIKIIGKIVIFAIGFSLVMAAIASFVAVIIGSIYSNNIFDRIFTDADFSFNAFMSQIVSTDNLVIIKICMLIFFVAPMILILVAGIKALFRIKTRVRVFAVIMVIAWLVSGAVLSLVSAIEGHRFIRQESLTNITELDFEKYDEVFIDVKSKPIEEVKRSSYFLEYDQFGVYSNKENNQFYMRPFYEFEKNSGGSFIETETFAHGKSKKTALRYAENVTSGFTQTDSLLVLDPLIKYPENETWNLAYQTVNIKIPDDKVVYVSSDMVNLLNCDDEAKEEFIVKDGQKWYKLTSW